MLFYTIYSDHNLSLHIKLFSLWQEENTFSTLVSKTHIYCYRFEVHEAPGSKSFFTDIISSISDIKFAKGGRYILSRDYMTLKVCISTYPRGVLFYIKVTAAISI